MTEILLLALLALLVTSALAAVLLAVVRDDARGWYASPTPPRSHPIDVFEHTGSTYR